jgi:uncharacterized protein YcbX
MVKVHAKKEQQAGKGKRDALISELTVYPVKSMKGIKLEKAVLTQKGLLHDRRWMVIRSDGRFVTQRELPRLALIQTNLHEDGLKLSLKDHGSISVPFEEAEGEPIRTKVWKDPCEVIDEGKVVSDWISGALGNSGPFRLVRMTPGFRRPQSRSESVGEETTTHFADSAPFLVANEASLEALNRELEIRGYPPVPMNRFRPNIVIRGPRPFSEHSISELEADAFILKFCHPCQRCVVTTINQETACKNPDWQPYKTLRDLNPMPGKPEAPAFGQNAVLRAKDRATITVGDVVKVRDHD